MNATTNGGQASSLNGGLSPKSATSSGLIHRTENGFTLLVGTFRSPELYTLQFSPPPPPPSASSTPTTKGTLTTTLKSSAAGGHSWLALSPSHTHLYTTVWASPPLIAAYALDPHTKAPKLLNTAPVASLSGYVAPIPSGSHLLSVGGPSGEVFRIDPSTGGFASDKPAQTLAFRTPAERDDGMREGVAHGSFGGLRWGAHSVDVGPDGGTVWVADIGHNCIWTYDLDETKAEVLTLREKHISPRKGDGPRHCWPHPSGEVVYCVQEHSGMVDAFSVGAADGKLAHMHGFSLLPEGKDPALFWADEVRTSNLPGGPPRWLYASTRGLDKDTKGYVAVFELDAQGGMVGGGARAVYETRTSGGLANAVEPAPRAVYESLGGEGWDGQEEYLALTDSEEGWVVVLGWDGRVMREVAAVRLEGAGAATAVWV